MRILRNGNDPGIFQLTCMGRIIRINLLNESVDLELQSFPFSDLQNSFPKLVVLIKRAKAWMVEDRFGVAHAHMSFSFLLRPVFKGLNMDFRKLEV